VTYFVVRIPTVLCITLGCGNRAGFAVEGLFDVTYGPLCFSCAYEKAAALRVLAQILAERNRDQSLARIYMSGVCLLDTAGDLAVGDEPVPAAAIRPRAKD
jgi:hypothetical protein